MAFFRSAFSDKKLTVFIMGVSAKSIHLTKWALGPNWGPFWARRINNKMCARLWPTFFILVLEAVVAAQRGYIDLKPRQMWRTSGASCAIQACARLMYLSRDIGHSFGTNSRHIWPPLLVGLALFWPPLLVELVPPLCRTPDHQRTIGDRRADGQGGGAEWHSF